MALQWKKGRRIRREDQDDLLEMDLGGEGGVEGRRVTGRKETARRIWEEQERRVRECEVTASWER